MQRTPYKSSAGMLDTESNAKLTAYLARAKPGNRTPDDEARLHCRHWHVGVGIVGAETPWVESPALTLERLGR